MRTSLVKNKLSYCHNNHFYWYFVNFGMTLIVRETCLLDWDRFNKSAIHTLTLSKILSIVCKPCILSSDKSCLFAISKG
jgi:hypothetical protein